MLDQTHEVWRRKRQQKTFKESRKEDLSARVSFLSIEFGAGGASKNKSSVAPAEPAKKQIESSAQRGTRHIKCGTGGASEIPQEEI